MTLSWPSALAAATRASMPPPAVAELAVAQLVPLLELLELLVLLELDELHAAVSTTPLAIAAVTASRCLARTFPPKHGPRRPGTKKPNLG